MKNHRLLLLAVASIAIAAGPGPAVGKVHTCVDPTTKAVTKSDTECSFARGPTPSEAVASAEAARVAAIAADVQLAAERADLQLLGRFRDEGIHRKAQIVELEGVIIHIRQAMERFGELKAQRKPLEDQAEFYKGKPLPPALQRAIDASDALFAAQTDVFRGLQGDVAEVVARYGNELDRLRKLWGGARPGSMGLLVPASTPVRTK